MAIASLPKTPPFWSTQPTGGLICIRKTNDGGVLAGLIHLEEDVHINPERGYLLVMEDGRMRLSCLPVADEVPDHMASFRVGELLEARIWPRTNRPDAWVVRFVEALPESNAWIMYGPNPTRLPESEPEHAWLSIGPEGQIERTVAPIPAQGMAVNQMLKHPVWPGPDGQKYSLPSTRPEWRAHRLRYQHALADVGSGEKTTRNAVESMLQDPYLRQLVRDKFNPDPDYCRYLHALRQAGELAQESPVTKEEFERTQGVARRFLEEILDLEPSDTTPNTKPGRPRLG